MHGDDGHQWEAGDGEDQVGNGNAEDQVPEDGIMGRCWTFEGSFVPECLILGADGSEVEVEELKEGHQEEHQVHSHDQVPEDGNHRLLLNIWRIFCYVPECLILGADVSDEVEEGHPEEQQPGAVRHLGQGIKVVSRVEEDGGGGGDVTLIRRGKFISDLESVLSWTNSLRSFKSNWNDFQGFSKCICSPINFHISTLRYKGIYYLGAFKIEHVMAWWRISLSSFNKKNGAKTMYHW